MAQFDLPLGQLEQYLPDVREPADFDAWWGSTLARARETPAVLAVDPVDSRTALHTLSYVDGVNFARRATAPAQFAVGLRDAVCPPSTVFAAYNHYAARGVRRPDTRIEVYPFNAHEGGDAVHSRRQLEWMRRLMPSPSALSAALTAPCP